MNFLFKFKKKKLKKREKRKTQNQKVEEEKMNTNKSRKSGKFVPSSYELETYKLAPEKAQYILYIIPVSTWDLLESTEYYFFNSMRLFLYAVLSSS